MSYTVTFCLGLVVSFAGSIPPAGINLTAIHIAIEKSKENALWFSAGAVFIEALFIFISLNFASYVASHSHWEVWIKWTAVLVFLLLGIAAFRTPNSAREKAEMKKQKGSNDFAYGMFLSVINPLQIPFWLAYGTYFYTNHWIDNALTTTLVFIVGAMTGTFALLYVYVVYASKVLSRIMKNTLSGKQLIGYIFLGLAAFQLVQNLWGHFKAQ